MKIIKFTGGVALVCVMLVLGILTADRFTLRGELIRMHIVANSNSEEDQRIKLQVRDAVVSYLSENMLVANVQDALAFLDKNSDAIKETAQTVLNKAGTTDNVNVTLRKESFDTRYYETFKLPAGVYNALRIEIGSGEGENWWCVAFPALCIPATSEGVETVAVTAGFDKTMTQTLIGTKEYEIRFFLLDCIGRLENLIFRS